MDSLAQSRRAGTTRRSDHRRTRATHRGPDTVQSFGNRSGAAVHTAGRHHRSVKLFEMPPPSTMRALHGTIGTVGGAAGTAMELARLFRGVPMVLSTPSQPRGVVSDIGFAPQLVIATPGAEPRVRGESPAQCEYRAVAILDAWTRRC